MPWKFETEDGPFTKHSWNKDYAGSIQINGVLVSKCPSSVTIFMAQKALNRGIVWNGRAWTKKHPQRIYSIIDGVVYRAVPTIPGKSYHGFPEFHKEISQNKLKNVVEKLEIMADNLNCRDDFDYWMKHGVDKRILNSVN